MTSSMIRTNSANRTHPVGEKKPNAWGLYDVYGNVSEWCWDYWVNSYSAIYQTDPHGPEISEAGTWRVMRGGSWVLDAPEFLSCSFRYDDVFPGNRSQSRGFRCVVGVVGAARR